MAVKYLIPDILSTLTLISSVALVLLFLGFVIKKSFNIRAFPIAGKAWMVIKKSSLAWAFVVALTATLGSLFYSEILGYTPCKLCWFQRIFMYPLVLILGINLYKNYRGIADYVIPMSVVGGAIALYHYGIQSFNYVTTCGVDSSVPCNIRYTFDYGYITIPMMALTAFIMITVLMYHYKKSKK